MWRLLVHGMAQEALWTGLLHAFLEAGFHEMPRWSPNRPIVRCEITQTG